MINVGHAALRQSFGLEVALIVPDGNERLQAPASETGKRPIDLDVAQWAFDHETEAGHATDTLSSSHYRNVLLKAPVRLRGVLAIRPKNPHWLHIPEQRSYIETFASSIAIALERVHFVQVVQSMLVNVESERLRNSLLAALSHDLRTPLTGLVGLTEALANASSETNDSQRRLAQEVRASAQRMQTMVDNLLDMARLQSGEIRLRKDWQSIEEIVGGAIRSLQWSLTDRAVTVQLPADLPLVELDAVLIERVFANLLENAAKYTPVSTPIVIEASTKPGWITVQISDRGPGLPASAARDPSILFEKFTRGSVESAKSGVGLGLSICKAIIEAHGGTMRAAQILGGGAMFMFDLPATSVVLCDDVAASANVT